MTKKFKSELIRVNFVALGCPKNLVDSEKMLGILVESGLQLVGPDDPAEVTIINTCGFIEDARAEAIEHIEHAVAQKRTGQVNAVLVTGCLAQLWGDKLFKRVPGVDCVVGLAHRSEIAQIVRELVKTTRKKPPQAPTARVGPFKSQVADDQVRLRLTEPNWAYLRISEGCNLGCAFCTIPKIRGPFRSKPLEAILAEAQELIADGAIELNLIGQETSGYGKDFNDSEGLAGLLRQLNQLDGLAWIRVLYTHPATLSEKEITAMAEYDKVVPYLDLPLQHINDRILKLMNRHITRSQTEAIIQALRKQIPEITLRTTMLVGFPSETDEEFDELLKFVRDTHFEALGCFAYSPEEETRAYTMQPAVPEETKQQRLEQIMIAQQKIAFEHADSLIGKKVDTLVTGYLTEEEVAHLDLDENSLWYVGRYVGQAAQIDSECYLRGNDKIDSAKILHAQIEGRREYDLIGKLID